MLQRFLAQVWKNALEQETATWDAKEVIKAGDGIHDNH
jgi:hypothetical protein